VRLEDIGNDLELRDRSHKELEEKLKGRKGGRGSGLRGWSSNRPSSPRRLYHGDYSREGREAKEKG